MLFNFHPQSLVENIRINYECMSDGEVECPFPQDIILCVKCVHTRSFSGPYFPVFGLNTEIYSANLHNQRERWKYGTENSEHGHFLRNDTVCC